MSEIAVGDYFVIAGRFDPRCSLIHKVERVSVGTVYYAGDKPGRLRIVDKGSIIFFGPEPVCKHLVSELDRFERDREISDRETRKRYAACRDSAISHARRMANEPETAVA